MRGGRAAPVCRSLKKSLCKLVFLRKKIYIYRTGFFYNRIPVSPGKTGFEPATSGLTDQRYKPLSYFPRKNELSTMIYYKKKTLYFVDDFGGIIHIIVHLGGIVQCAVEFEGRRGTGDCLTGPGEALSDKKRSRDCLTTGPGGLSDAGRRKTDGRNEKTDRVLGKMGNNSVTAFLVSTNWI